MENEEEEEDLPLIIRIIVFGFQVVVVILVIVFTILTLGIFLQAEDENVPKQRRLRIPSIEEKLRITLQRKKHRLIEVRKRISELQLIVNKIRRTEKRMLFAVRFVITALLVGVNWVYLVSVKGISLDHVSNDSAACIELITNFNALILLLYSLPAYLLYGTVGRFTSAMKAKTVSILRRKHIPSLSELQLLREEEQQIIRDIGYLRTSLELFE
jgi:hypothetical protein